MLLIGSFVPVRAQEEPSMKAVQSPQYLYKIISPSQWEESQKLSHVQLTVDDASFIHLATEEQVDRIIDKYWGDFPQVVVLALDPQLLCGRLVLEANPGGTHQYYHLYEGLIPCSAVVEVKRIDSRSRN